MSKLIAIVSAILALFINSPKTTHNVSVIVTGDIMLGRTVMITSLTKNDPTYPFLKVADQLKKSDLVFANLENPIISDCPEYKSGFKFCSDPKMIQGLTFAGVDIVNLANNHTLNFGSEGLEQTKKYLTSNGINYVGDNNLVIKDVEGKKFGFLGFDFLDHEASDTDFQLIKDSKQKVDVLLVMVHWGIEYTNEPVNSQKLLAGKIIDSGADVLIGGHSHSVQPIEKLNNGLVFYSLGNFIFDQPWSEGTKKGLAIKLEYDNGRLKNYQEMPIYMSNLAQPDWVK